MLDRLQPRNFRPFLGLAIESVGIAHGQRHTLFNVNPSSAFFASRRAYEDPPSPVLICQDVCDAGRHGMTFAGLWRILYELPRELFGSIHAAPGGPSLRPRDIPMSEVRIRRRGRQSDT